MLTAKTQAGFSVTARESERNGTFFCPFCKEQVILKKGKTRIPHFAHYPESDCNYSGESMAHLEMKEMIANWFQGDLWDMRIEEVISHHQEKRIADILLIDRDFDPPIIIAIECQHSPILWDDFLERSLFYLNQDTKILWIFDLETYFKTTAFGNAEFLVVTPLFRKLSKLVECFSYENSSFCPLILDRRLKRLERLWIGSYKYRKGQRGRTTKYAFFRKEIVNINSYIERICQYER